MRLKLSVKDVVGPLQAKDGNLVTDNGKMCNNIIIRYWN